MKETIDKHWDESGKPGPGGGKKPISGLRKLLIGLTVAGTLISPLKVFAEPKPSEIMRIEFLADYQIAIEYDTDNDGAGDVKYLYSAWLDENLIWVKPYAFMEDKDRNGTYDNDKVIYINGVEKKLEEVEKKFIARK